MDMTVSKVDRLNNSAGEDTFEPGTKLDVSFRMLPSLIARRWVRLKAIHFSWLGPELLVCCLAHRGSIGVFLLLRIFSKLLSA